MSTIFVYKAFNRILYLRIVVLLRKKLFASPVFDSHRSHTNADDSFSRRQQNEPRVGCGSRSLAHVLSFTDVLILLKDVQIDFQEDTPCRNRHGQGEKQQL